MSGTVVSIVDTLVVFSHISYTGMERPVKGSVLEE